MTRQLIVEVGLLAGASFIQGAGFSLIAPFYPDEAFRRVCSQWIQPAIFLEKILFFLLETANEY